MTDAFYESIDIHERDPGTGYSVAGHILDELGAVQPEGLTAEELSELVSDSEVPASVMRTWLTALRARFLVHPNEGAWFLGHDIRLRPERRVPRGTTLKQQEYYLPILRVLAAATNGMAPTRVVMKGVYEQVSHRLNQLDHALLPSSGEPRWENRITFARLDLIKRGFMKKDSPRGLWEITEEGRRWAPGTGGVMAEKITPQEPAMRIATYTRISTDEEHQPYSLEAQSDRLDASADRNGALLGCACLTVNGVGEPCAGESHARFAGGPLARRTTPRRGGTRTQGENPRD